MMTTNLFVIANVKRLRTGSFRILLYSFRTSWRVGVLNSEIFKLIRMLDTGTLNILRSICNLVRLCQNFGILVGL
jgi:hypothetical protein